MQIKLCSVLLTTWFIMTGPLETSVKGQFQQSASILHGKLHVLFTWAVEHNTADFLYGHSDNAVFICPERIRIEVHMQNLFDYNKR